MKIQRSSIAALLAAHKSLSGDLESKTRYNASRNTLHLTRAHKDVERFRVELVTRLAPDTLEVKPDSPRWEEFTNEFYAFLNGEIDLDLRRLSFSGLRLEKNPIPPGAISALDPLIDLDDPAPSVTG